MSNPLKSALFAALWAFIGSFTPALLGFTAAVAAWADSQGASALPDLSVLGYAAVSAFIAAFSGLVAFGVRTLQEHGYVPGNAPQYGKVIDVLPVAEAVVVQDPANEVAVEPLKVAEPLDLAPQVAEPVAKKVAAKKAAAPVKKAAKKLP